jgi:hypothetical protein
MGLLQLQAYHFLALDMFLVGFGFVANGLTAKAVVHRLRNKINIIVYPY